MAKRAFLPFSQVGTDGDGENRTARARPPFERLEKLGSDRLPVGIGRDAEVIGDTNRPARVVDRGRRLNAPNHETSEFGFGVALRDERNGLREREQDPKPLDLYLEGRDGLVPEDRRVAGERVPERFRETHHGLDIQDLGFAYLEGSSCAQLLASRGQTLMILVPRTRPTNRAISPILLAAMDPRERGQPDTQSEPDIGVFARAQERATS